ncbi:Ribonuclease H-like domain [Trinorchestia longiramus]|nr:Ribonuclease H-like domain [Trinorchestia longiramus]
MEDEAKNNKILANDVALSEALANSVIGIAGISNIKKNLGRNILVVTMKKHYEDVSPFLSVLEIGAWKVKYRLPANQITSVGAIGPFRKDTSSEELTEALIDAGFGLVIVERICKGKDKIVTAFFKVVFNTTTLPQFVHIGYQQYRVSTYIGKPWQCFICQRFGHNAVNCRAAPRCVVCSGAHNSRECPSPSTRSCCNCSGNHTANYGGCPKIRQARGVEKIRQIQKLSYRDAARQVIECELHAIHEALSWISENSAPSDKYVIFADSLSSLYLIHSTKPKYYIPLVYNIQNKLINIISSHCIRLQFIPGHRAPRPTQTVDKLDPALETCTHVYVRVDAVKPALTRPYEDPFLVIKRTAKYFIIEKHGKQDLVSIDRLKAAFVSDALIPNNLPPPDVTDLPVDDKSLLKPPVRRLQFAPQLAASLPSSIPSNPFLIPSRSLDTHFCHSNTPVVISRQPVSTNAAPITHMSKLNLQTRTVILPKPVQVFDRPPDCMTRSGRKVTRPLRFS